MQQGDKHKSAKRVWISIAVIAYIAVSAALIVYNSHKNDMSILDVYAQQQDAYVQLVLDQINIQSDKNDDELINDILGSLDSSNRKYWTLSKGDAILFVKDVLETNRYKGITTESYYVSDSAAAFLEGLELNRVTHGVIDVEDSLYVASGVVFEYNENQYRVCLLTNQTIVLDNNSYMSAKIALYIISGGTLVVLLLAVIGMTFALGRSAAKNAELESRVSEQNLLIESLTGKIRSYELYNSKDNVFNSKLLPQFARQLRAKQGTKVMYAGLTFENAKKKLDFLVRAQVLLDKRALRFDTEKDDELIILFVGYTQAEAENALGMLGVKAENIKKLCEWDMNAEGEKQ